METIEKRVSTETITRRSGSLELVLNSLETDELLFKNKNRVFLHLW